VNVNQKVARGGGAAFAQPVAARNVTNRFSGGNSRVPQKSRIYTNVTKTGY